jgi:hypothetical protein
MSKRRSLVLIASLPWLLVVLPQPACALGPSPGPEDVARNSLNDLKADRIEDFVKAMHPEALTQLRSALLKIYDEGSRAGRGGEILSLFAGVNSSQDLKSRNDASFMVAYLRGSTRHIPNYKQTMQQMDAQIIGRINEGQDKAYVIYRSKRLNDGDHPGMIKAIGLRKNGPGWGLLLGDDIEVVLLMLKQKVEGKGAMPKFEMAASTVEPLGLILEGEDKAHEVFRLTTPMNGSKVSKVSVLSVTKNDPEWTLVQGGKKEEIRRLIEQSVGIRKAPSPAINKAGPGATRPSINRPGMASPTNPGAGGPATTSRSGASSSALDRPSGESRAIPR